MDIKYIEIEIGIRHKIHLLEFAIVFRFRFIQTDKVIYIIYIEAMNRNRHSVRMSRKPIFSSSFCSHSILGSLTNHNSISISSKCKNSS
jgi:hypothetical protein